MRYRIQADPKLPIARFNGTVVTVTKMLRDSDYPYRVKLVGGQTLMLKMTELRPE